jgi:hypothetical protein
MDDAGPHRRECVAQQLNFVPFRKKINKNTFYFINNDVYILGLWRD